MEYRAICSDDHKALAHYGHKGMRWGHRQWQNPDGSLTDAGRIHYGIGKARDKANKTAAYVKKEAKRVSQSVKNSLVTSAGTALAKKAIGYAKKGANIVAKNAAASMKVVVPATISSGKSVVSAALANPEIAGAVGFGLFTAGMVGLGAYGAYKSIKQVNSLATSQKKYYDERIHPNAKRESSHQIWSRLENDPGYIKVKDKSNGGHALVKVEDSNKAAASLHYLGYSDEEIRKLLGGGSLKHSLYLSHHGTKGMHWGDRKWQNLDGSLTPAGYIHYGYKGPRKVSKRTQGKIDRLKKKQADADAAMTKAASQYNSAHARAKKATNKSKYGVSVFRNPQKDYEKAVKERDKASEGYYRAKSQKEKAQASLDSIAKRERFKQDTVWTAKKIARTAGLIAKSTSDKINDAISNRNTNKLLKASKELRNSEPEKKAEFLNSLSEINGNTARVQPVIYDVLLSSVGQISRALNVTPFTIKTQFDFDYTGPLDDKKFIMFGRDDMKKAFPGLNDTAGEQASTYVFDAYLERTNKMRVEANDDGSLWTISESSEKSKKTANDKKAYINASRDGFTTHVELTKNRRFTIESLDTLGFTNQEIADKLGLSIGQVGEVLYGYEAWK